MSTSTGYEIGSSSDIAADSRLPVPLANFPSNSREHILRVKVIRKFEPVQNPGKGQKAKLTLFGDNIEIYSSIFTEDEIFDIKNVTVKEGNEEYGVYADKVIYVHNSSEIVPVPMDTCLLDFLPMYLNIFETRSITISDQSFDLVAVVVHVGCLEGKHTRSGRAIQMYKLSVTDDSCEDVIPIVLWGSIAQEGNRRSNVSDEPTIVSFSGLRKNIFKANLHGRIWDSSRRKRHP